MNIKITTVAQLRDMKAGDIITKKPNEDDKAGSPVEWKIVENDTDNEYVMLGSTLLTDKVFEVNEVNLATGEVKGVTKEAPVKLKPFQKRYHEIIEEGSWDH
jgi:hypothetical protein